jgi:hypothetical protein
MRPTLIEPAIILGMVLLGRGVVYLSTIDISQFCSTQATDGVTEMEKAMRTFNKMDENEPKPPKESLSSLGYLVSKRHP